MLLNSDKLRSLLDQRGMNQADLARATGWSEAKVSRFVNGTQGEVTLTSISTLARALHCTEATLVDLEDVAQSEDERALLRNYRAAAERDRRLAREQVAPLPTDTP